MRKSSVLSQKKENKILPEEKSSSENVKKTLRCNSSSPWKEKKHFSLRWNERSANRTIEAVFRGFYASIIGWVVRIWEGPQKRCKHPSKRIPNFQMASRQAYSDASIDHCRVTDMQQTDEKGKSLSIIGIRRGLATTVITCSFCGLSQTFLLNIRTKFGYGLKPL